MIISHKYNFIFIAVPKTGTTSIQRSFKSMKLSDTNITEYLSKQIKTHRLKNRWMHVDICNTKEPSRNQIDRPYFTKHMTAKALKEKCRDDGVGIFDKYFKFAFVRNPYARAVSWIYYELRKSEVDFNKYSFKELMLKCPDWIWASQSNWIYSDDRKLVDFVGKFENIQEDFNVICDKIGIPHQKLPHKNKTEHKHYTEYYDDETREIVAEKYAKDIEYFGYEFEA